jgi:hypothetical protein
MEATQANFEGWAVVELFGHQRECGFVTTQVFGQACLFRIDVPEIPAHEHTLERPEWIGGTFAAAGSKVKREGVQGRTRLIGPGAVYAMNPCTEEAARKMIERMFQPPLRLIEAAPGSRETVNVLPAPDDTDDPDPGDLDNDR